MFLPAIKPLDQLQNMKFVIFIIEGLINPFLKKPLFSHVCSTSLENTGGKGEIKELQEISPFPSVL